jgi:lipoyl(octanoyl) transferase
MLNVQRPSSAGDSRRLEVRDLGLIRYAECWEVQNQLAAAVGSGQGSETLLLLEHLHTYTCGRRGGRAHILIGPEQLQREGVTVLDVDRGGDVTYHGPGQIVAYPIFDLARSQSQLDYPGYVRSLEHVLIRTLADFALDSHQLEGFSGAWVSTPVGEAKIAAVGVKVDGRGITTHGIALNVAPEMRFFGYIVPCGITGKGVTCMRELLPEVPSADEVKRSFVRHFAQEFGFRTLSHN